MAANNYVIILSVDPGGQMCRCPVAVEIPQGLYEDSCCLGKFFADMTLPVFLFFPVFDLLPLLLPLLASAAQQHLFLEDRDAHTLQQQLMLRPQVLKIALRDPRLGSPLARSLRQFVRLLRVFTFPG